MSVKLFDYQKKAITQLKSGSILRGGVGSGKSITGLAFYYISCGGQIDPKLTALKEPKDLYIITTPRKRDTLDWNGEAANFGITTNRSESLHSILLTVDSWNNIGKYKEVKDAFFIFDEQKVVGYGAWVKAFLKIAKNNKWVLLTATPGDTWSDYIPVFIANGYFDNKSKFAKEHIVFNTYTSYPKIDRYVGTKKLEKLKAQILVEMEYKKKTVSHISRMIMPFDKDLFSRVKNDYWNPYTNAPIENGSQYHYNMRKVVNSHPSRLDQVLQLYHKHRRVIVFYNFDYELDILRKLGDIDAITVAEYNGHLHEPVPETDRWIYLAQYLSAGEAWNCTDTDTVVLYSRNYSYKQTVQAMGRIDRQNTPFQVLYYYFLTSDAWIDKELERAYNEKRNFNEPIFPSRGEHAL